MQNVMRHLLIILLTVCLVNLTSCDANDYDPNATPKEAFTNVISESYSPDKTKLLTVKEHGWKGESGHTQVFIEFQNSGSGVYVVDTLGVGIKAYWVSNNALCY